MFDKLRSMEVLVAVADAGSFAAAARALDLTPAMVGRHVQALETHLGARLIQRTTRQHRITEVGLAFTQDCRRVLEQVRWAETAVERSRSEPQGQLRVSVAVALGQVVIGPLVADFLMRHPQVSVELHLSDGVSDLLGEGFDAAIRIGPLHADGMVARPMRPYRMVIAGAPAYFERHGEPRTAADLARHACLSHSVWQRRSEWALSGGRQTLQWPQTARFTANQGDALRRAALRGLGLVLQPEVLLADDLAAGRLRAVLPDCVPPERPVHLIYPPDRQRLPKLGAFIDAMLAGWGPQTSTPGQTKSTPTRTPPTTTSTASTAPSARPAPRSTPARRATKAPARSGR
ncbi:LysR family transcriptional regulator [Roseateles aquatilis]|uniref:LysR family transcriptional regulator n=1 Tax=Roseateles aquatilis TaxID=431061 RepID=A0A2D0ALT3_9BURK|nr:LysR substrate-binding domain-containing protein [Roseateles aquatilis]OWQ83060.1 LysR family transcriptional regulator [Roseateles aquatilis]